MADYYKIDSSHFLSSFEVALPHWHGEKGIRRPFQPWASGERLGWYRAYNEAKHDRREGFKTATFEHAIDAVCGVLVVLSAQFGAEDFSLTDIVIGGARAHRFRHAIGSYFVVRYPILPVTEHYAFNWYGLLKEEDPFQNFPYTTDP
jgi:hypothetical protein